MRGDLITWRVTRVVGYWLEWEPKVSLRASWQRGDKRPWGYWEDDGVAQAVPVDSVVLPDP